MIRLVIFVAVTVLFTAVSLPVLAWGQHIPRGQVAGFLQAHCRDCHLAGANEGGLDLDALDLDLSDASTFAIWERVVDRVRLGEMPPEDVDAEIPRARRSEFLSIVEPLLAEAHVAIAGTVYRRLNRREYQNTLNDIFGTHVNLEDRLPEDGRHHEFDNVGAALGISLVHMQQYLQAADDVMAAAIASTPSRPESKTISANYAATREGEKHIGEVWKKLPDNSVVFFRQFGYPTGMLRGTEVTPPGRYRVRVTGYAYQSQEPITFRVGGTSFERGSSKPTYGYFELPPGEPSSVEFETYIEPRYMIEIDPWGLDNGKSKLRTGEVDSYPGPGLAIQEVELTGPLVEEFPTRGHRLLFDGFTRRALAPKKKWQKETIFELESSDPHRDARAALLRIAEKAFRRPVTSGDISPYLKLFEQQLEHEASLEEALRTAVSAIFCSPDFLYIHEPRGPLDDYAIATRLAYFLTRTLPDETLYAAAAQGRLSGNNPELLAHARRLLADSRHQRFIQDFCDAWLNLREIDFTSPDQLLYPEYDNFLRYSMLAETRGFMATLINDNLPIRHIIQSDFGILNNRLAQHYAIEGVNGPNLRVASLPRGSLRGGLLGQASILKVSANGTNTSPVVRGAWVMQRILGKTPPPPPPGISGVEPDIRGATTLRELLDKHRNSDDCRVCHSQIDPPGFALECFDPIGGYRERFRSLGEGERVQLQQNGIQVRYKLGPSVDASGVLPDGRAFTGFEEFRTLLVQDTDRLAQAFTMKVLTFATGRPMGFSDRPTLEKIVNASRAGGHRVRDLIELVITSDAFLKN